MNKEELKKEIQDIEDQIKTLEKSKKELVDKFLKLDFSKGEQIQNILDHGGHEDWLIDYTPEGILEHYVGYYERHTIVELEGIIENLHGLSYHTPSFEEQVEVFKMFGIEEEFTKLGFDEAKESKYSKEYSMKDFEDLWDDIVKAGVKSFTFDW